RRTDRAACVAVADLVEAELVQPLPAAAARSGGDADRDEVARPAARGHGGCDRGALGADPERIGGVLDVDARELAAVARTDDCADEVARIRRVGANRSSLGLRDELAHRASWKSVSVVNEPSSPPSSTSSVEWTPDSMRVCATRSAITNAIDETTNR